MSDTQVPEPPDPHTALYQQIQQGMHARGMLDELLTDKLGALLSGTAQNVADALYLTCMQLDTRMADTLITVHVFLDNYYCIVAHNKEQAV